MWESKNLLTIFSDVDDSVYVKAIHSEYTECEQTFFAYLTILSASVLIWFEKQYSYRPSFSAVIDTLPVDCLMCLPRARLSGSANFSEFRAEVR